MKCDIIQRKKGMPFSLPMGKEKGMPFSLPMGKEKQRLKGFSEDYP